MHPKDLAAKYDVKIFDSREAAQEAGFALGARHEARNAWNRDSHASAILFDLIGKRKRGEASEVALVLDMYGVAGATKGKDEGGSMKDEKMEAGA